VTQPLVISIDFLYFLNDLYGSSPSFGDFHSLEENGNSITYCMTRISIIQDTND
jgi:hypothetical protein